MPHCFLCVFVCHKYFISKKKKTLIMQNLCLAAFEPNGSFANMFHQIKIRKKKKHFTNLAADRLQIYCKPLAFPETFSLHSSQLLPLTSSIHALLIVNRFFFKNIHRHRQLLERNWHDCPCFPGCKCRKYIVKNALWEIFI